MLADGSELILYSPSTNPIILYQIALSMWQMFKVDGIVLTGP